MSSQHQTHVTKGHEAGMKVADVLSNEYGGGCRSMFTLSLATVLKEEPCWEFHHPAKVFLLLLKELLQKQ